jgi:hypothetical protein
MAQRDRPLPVCPEGLVQRAGHEYAAHMRWGKLRDASLGMQGSDWVTDVPEGTELLDEGATIWRPAIRAKSRQLDLSGGEAMEVVIIAIADGSGYKRPEIQRALERDGMLFEKWFIPAR